MPRLIFLVVLVSSLGFVLWHMVKFFLSVNNSWSKIDKECDEAKAIIKQSKDELVPWKAEELELLSIKPEIIDSSNKLNETVEGYIKNIYSERVLHFIFKDYDASSRRSFMVMQSSSDTFEFRFKGDEMSLAVNDQKIAQTNNASSLSAINKNTELTLETISEDKEYKEIYSSGERIALLANPKSPYLSNDRAIRVLDAKRTADFPDQLVLGLLGLELIESNII